MSKKLTVQEIIKNTDKIVERERKNKIKHQPLSIEEKVLKVTTKIKTSGGFCGGDNKKQKQ
jgi:hypothetical protein